VGDFKTDVLMGIIHDVSIARRYADDALVQFEFFQGEGFSCDSLKSSSHDLISFIEECCVAWGSILTAAVKIAEFEDLSVPYRIRNIGSIKLKPEDILSSVNAERLLEIVELVSKVYNIDVNDSKFSYYLFGIISVAVAAIGDFGQHWKYYVDDEIFDNIDLYFETEEKD
jgi:hypothetical protein